MQTSGLMAKGPPAGAPAFLLFIRIAIIVLSVIILGLAAWAISIFGGGSYYYGYYSYSGVAGLLIFAVIKTWIIYGALTLIELKAPQYYFRIVAIIAYAISIIFWLSAWAWSASNAAAWLSLDDYIYRGSNPYRNEGAALAACAGLGAILWILSIVHLVFLIKACLSDPASHTAPTHSSAELGQVGHGKTEAQTAVYPAQATQPVQYSQPAVYQQQQPYGGQTPAYGQPAQPYQQ